MIIGLTGGISTGKTTLSNELKSWGYKIIDADCIAKEMLSKGSPVLEAVIDLFGEQFLLEDNSLNRKALATLIFQDEHSRKQLNELMHPLIILDIKNQLRGCTDICFLVAPLLFEVGLDQLCDEVWQIHTDYNVQVQRLIQRDLLTETEAIRRVAAQQAKVHKITHQSVKQIVNNGDPQHLFLQAKNLLKEVR